MCTEAAGTLGIKCWAEINKKDLEYMIQKDKKSCRLCKLTVHTGAYKSIGAVISSKTKGYSIRLNWDKVC